MTISGVLGATTHGPTGSVFQQVFDHISGLDYKDSCNSNFNFYIQDRSPDWIIQVYPKFIKFIEKFYEWLGCENDMAIIESIKDVDVAPDYLIKLYKDIFADGFPDKTFEPGPSTLPYDAPIVDFFNPSTGQVDVRNFLRHAKEFYQMKSIEEVYDYFFRVFYNSWVNITYPKTLILRCSEAPFRGASASDSTGAPCDYWGQTGENGATGDCWFWDPVECGYVAKHCWNPYGRTAGTPTDIRDCTQNCAPGSPCGVYYDDEFGTLSGLSKIQDSKIWQDYSYLIDSNVAFETYWPYVKKLIHPTGLYAAGNYTIWDFFDKPGVTGDVVKVENPITGFYGPYRFDTDINLRDNPSGVDLYPCGWLPYLGGSGHVAGVGDYGVCGASYSAGHFQDSGGLWYISESGVSAHEPRLAGIPTSHGFTAAPIGLTGHTGGFDATVFGGTDLPFFQIFHHPNSWSEQVPVGTKMKDIELGQFLMLSPIVGNTPNNKYSSTGGCGF